MRSTILLLAVLFIATSAVAQVQTQIVGDSVRIHGNTGTAELNLENSTDTVPGFLFNKGLGRTQFKRALVRINDTTYLIGADTLHIHAGGGGAPALKWYQESATPAGSNNYSVTGPYAVATAGQSHQVYGINSAAIGGLGNIVGGNNSFGVGDNSVVVGGFQNLDSCVDCVILGGDDNILHPGAVNSVLLGTGHSSIYPFNSFIASASVSTINGPSGNNGIGEAIVGGSLDTVRGDGGTIFGGIGANSYSFGEMVTGIWPTAYTPASSTSIVGTDRLFNIGNGTSGSARSDAFTVYKNGNALINGSATVGSVTDQVQLKIKTPAAQSTANPILQVLSPSGTGVLEVRGNDDGTQYTGFGLNLTNGSQYIGKNSGKNAQYNTASSFAVGNVSLGPNTLASVTTGHYNTALGADNLRSLTTGNWNTGFGENTFSLLVSGSDNICVGQEGMINLTTGSANTGVGNNVMGALSTGNNNVAIGNGAGASATGNGGVYIGFQAGRFDSTANKLYIANSNTATPLIYGQFDSSILKLNANVYVGGSSAPTAALHLRAGTAAPGTAPLKFTSGALLSVPEAGATEFSGNSAYLTISAGRKEITLNDVPLTPGQLPLVGTNGRLTNTGITFDNSYGTMVYGIPGYSYRGNGVVPLDDRIGIQLTNLATAGTATSFNLAAPPPAITFNGSGWSSTNSVPENVQFATWVQVVGGIPTPAGIYTISSRLNKNDLSVFDPYTNLFTVNSGGYANLLKSMFIGDVATVPTAILHLAGGNASASGAPIKLTAGTVLSTPEGGAIEYDGSDLYMTSIANTRYKLVKALTGQLVTNFGAASVNAFSFVTANLSVPGAQPGNTVAVNANSGAVNSPAVIITAYVGAANTVTIRAYNAGNSAVTMASDTYNVKILQ